MQKRKEILNIVRIVFIILTVLAVFSWGVIEFLFYIQAPDESVENGLWFSLIHSKEHYDSKRLWVFQIFSCIWLSFRFVSIILFCHALCRFW